MKNFLILLLSISIFSLQARENKSAQKRKKKKERVILDPLFAKKNALFNRRSIGFSVGYHHIFASKTLKKNVDPLFNFKIFTEKRYKDTRSHTYLYQYLDFSQSPLAIQTFGYQYKMYQNPKSKKQFFWTLGANLYKINRFELHTNGGYYSYGPDVGFGYLRELTKKLYFSLDANAYYIFAQGNNENKMLMSNISVGIHYYFDPFKLKQDVRFRYIRKKSKRKSEQ